MDSTVIATSLPAIAADIGTNPLALKLAVTSYLLSLAIFIPASGWIADRFGARTVFSSAIAIFMIGSIGCALSSSLTDFVIARIVQGIGGAMMSPVGRIVLVRTISKRELIAAMAWVTTPALVGPVVGPPIGGFITTYASWHWIFLINIPIGILGIVLTHRFIENVKAEQQHPFDFIGMVLVGFGLAGLAFGFSTAGLHFMPRWVVATLIVTGAIFVTAYLLHARRTPVPALDLALFRIQTFRTGLIGGFIFRLGVGALPFLLPLMLQLGFGLTPFHSGLVTFASAIGAMGMKTATTRVLRRFGFRNILLFNAIVGALSIGLCALFTPATPVVLISLILFIGGFFRSLQFTAVNTIAYADIEPARVSRATSLAAVAQPMAIASGIALGAFAVDMTAAWHGRVELMSADFPPAFLIVALISASSFLIFRRLPHDAGSELSGRGIASQNEKDSENTAPTDAKI